MKISRIGPLRFAHVLAFTFSLAAATGNAWAQGTLYFYNHVSNMVVAPIYGPEWLDGGWMALSGNDFTGYPPGGQVYHGELLSGTNYTAELWGGPEGSSEQQLVPLARTSFRTGAGAGFVRPVNVSGGVPGVSAGQRATLQLRVWDNQGGFVTDWSQPLCAWSPQGKSPLFVSDPILPLGIVYLTGLQSFCLWRTLSSPYYPRVSRGDTGLFFIFGSISAFEGEHVTLWASCDPVGPMVQWSMSGTNLPGATNAFLDFPRIRLDQGGSYGLRVTYYFGWTDNFATYVEVLPQPLFLQPHFDPSGGFVATLMGATNRVLVLEASRDLVSWMPWQTQSFAGTAAITLPTSATNVSQFFRARAIP